MDNKVKGYLVSGPEYTIFVAGDWLRASSILDAMECRLHLDVEDYTITEAVADIDLMGENND